ncbi:uncharacterized protein METZ01_LOCUS278786 [marine metagenome]|uniref:Uncharacterized protein n=1 Tax=marine metagenome TaxID=408172 RepID=A0A382KRQ3_9ZZZZ
MAFNTAPMAFGQQITENTTANKCRRQRKSSATVTDRDGIGAKY